MLMLGFWVRLSMELGNPMDLKRDFGACIRGHTFMSELYSTSDSSIANSVYYQKKIAMKFVYPR